LISHQLVTFKSKLLDGAVVKLVDGAIKAHLDVLWRILISWVVALAWQVLLVEVIGEWAAVSKELSKDVESFSTV